MDKWMEEMIDREWDEAEAEMLEQVNLVTGQPLVRLDQCSPPLHQANERKS